MQRYVPDHVRASSAIFTLPGEDSVPLMSSASYELEGLRIQSSPELNLKYAVHVPAGWLRSMRTYTVAEEEANLGRRAHTNRQGDGAGQAWCVTIHVLG